MKKSNIFFTMISLLTACILLAVDIFSKNLAAANLSDGSEKILIPKILSLNLLEGGNSGAAWGIFSGKISFLLILTITIVVIILVIYFKINRSIAVNSIDGKVLMKFRLLQISFAILIAGALGNIIDRIRLGYVIDFFEFKFISFPIFNVADCYIVVSAIFLLILFSFVIKDDELAYVFKKRKN